MLRRVEKFIEKKELLVPNAKVIVGLSGGADSMALLDILTLLGYTCIAAHCNFHLRGEESNSDAAFVKQWCKSTDIELTSIDFDTEGYAADKKISIEMAARELRYRWFEIIRQQYEAHAIAVAHHKDDSIETVLLNLTRGTGIHGLTGIAPKNGYVVRPLLCLSRLEVENYLEERDIPHVLDSTNNETIYVRNFLRLNTIPELEKLNPSVKDAIFRTSDNITEAEKVYKRAIENDICRVFSDNKIDISELLKTASPQSVLFELLSPLGFQSSVIDDILNSLEGVSGKVFYSNKHRLIKDREYLLLDKIGKGESQNEEFFIDKFSQEITIPVHLNIKLRENDNYIEKAADKLYADVEKLTFPLVLRKWKQGDWFVPFGMKGRKKLSDYFSDQKFSLKDKENCWILTSGDDVVWIVGERSDNRFRVTEETKNVLCVERVC